MCGRTCLTLSPSELQLACRYQMAYNELSSRKSDQQHQPSWRAEYNLGKKFVPSFNLSPTDIVPVLISSNHFATQYESPDRRVLTPMMWGIIPPWHKGDYRKHGLTTNNCRLEGMMNSKLYKKPFESGQRCAVLCEGFYEWQTTKDTKSSERPVYFLYMAQKDGIVIEDRKSWETAPEKLSLLRLAGLFDVWLDGNSDKMYSFSVITFESDSALSWLHHRTPGILETEEQVSDWLDFKRVSDKTALETLRSATLASHPVSNFVNNSKNKSSMCNKPSGDLILKTHRSEMIERWLIKKNKLDENTTKEALKIQKNISVAYENI